MNLISCENKNCGCVIDLNRREIPNIIKDNGEIDIELSAWDGERHVPIIHCPACGNKIKLWLKS